jgi:hypothetical protein
MKPAIHSQPLKKTLCAAALIPLLAGTNYAQETKEKDSRASTAVTKATNAAEAVLKKLPSIPGAADAKVINIHIGDNITFGFDEGIDAEEWGMTENNNAPSAVGANPAKSGAKPNPEKPQGFRKIDFRKGDLVLVASEEPVKETAPTTAAQPEPAVNTTTPEPTPAPDAAAPTPAAAP